MNSKIQNIHILATIRVFAEIIQITSQKCILSLHIGRRTEQRVGQRVGQNAR